MFGTGFSALGPDWREKTDFSEVEDIYGFRYYLVTLDWQDVSEEVQSTKGHNGSTLTLVHTSSQKGNRGYKPGLHHKDKEWRKRIFGRLIFVVRKPIELNFATLQYEEEEPYKEVVFEGTLADADEAQSQHKKERFKDCDTVANIFAKSMANPTGYFFEEIRVLPSDQEKNLR